MILRIPTTSNIEQYKKLDDKNHIFNFRILKRCNYLPNYWFVTLFQQQINRRLTTITLESLIVDVRHGNTTKDIIIGKKVLSDLFWH